MTVKQLINELNRYDWNRQVKVYAFDSIKNVDLVQDIVKVSLQADKFVVIDSE